MSTALIYRELKIVNVHRLALSVGCAILALAGISAAQAADEMAPLDIKLPVAHQTGTKQDTQLAPNVDPLQTNRVAFLAPKGVVNLAMGKKVTTSDTNLDVALLPKVVDGDKKFESDSIVLLRKGVQWVQVDLG